MLPLGLPRRVRIPDLKQKVTSLLPLLSAGLLSVSTEQVTSTEVRPTDPVELALHGVTETWHTRHACRTPCSFTP